MRTRAMRNALAIVLTAAAVVGCNGPKKLTPEGERLLQQGKDAFDRGDDAAAIARMDRFVTDNVGMVGVDQAYYYRGRAKYRGKDLPGAAADMDQAVARTEDDGLRASARIVLGDIAYDRGQMASAAESYGQALDEIPLGKKPADHALFRLGCTLQRQGKWVQADLRFDRLIYLFPKSKVAALAGRRIRGVAWTVQVGAYRKKSRADQAAAALRADRLAAEVRPILQEGRPLFLVQAGRFQGYDQAAARLPELRRLHPDAFVTVTQ